MKNLLTIFLILNLNVVSAMDNHESHIHSGHNHTKMTNQTEITDANNKMYESFVANLVDAQVAVVDVNGMVCDFCARGIEKTFYDDKAVKKVDVNLETGKVLIAYSNSKDIDIEEIKKIFLSNGQTATKVIIKKIL